MVSWTASSCTLEVLNWEAIKTAEEANIKELGNVCLISSVINWLLTLVAAKQFSWDLETETWEGLVHTMNDEEIIDFPTYPELMDFA